MGLMFKNNLPVDSGLLISENSESKLNTSIHMLFMNFDILAVWISKDLKVVDTQYAKRWHLGYFPGSAAQFVLELNPYKIDDFIIGDQLQFQYEN